MTLVGMVGRIERYKGHEDLIEGISFLPENYQKNIKLVFIGPGSNEEISRLQHLAEYLNVADSILFTGYISGSTQDLIKQLDLLSVMTKDFEGFGLTIGEAMCAGTPVMATKVGAVTEFINERVATLMSPESPFEAGIVLKELIEKRDIFSNKAELASQHIKKYSGEHMAARFQKIMSLN